VTAATGGYTLRRARGELATKRVVELRAARQGNRTGSIHEYNFLMSLLPQDTRVCYVRYETIPLPLVSLSSVPRSLSSVRSPHTYPHFFLPRLLAPPIGYNVGTSGLWPAQGCWMVKVRCCPTWKSTLNPQNFHTVTLLLAHQGNPQHNPLMMPAGLEQLVDWHCSCRAGLRTCASCCHRDSVLLVLCATSCWDSGKAAEPLLVDPLR
jgi:hypothetical protein